jgi:Tol biopolymer transport system component
MRRCLLFVTVIALAGCSGQSAAPATAPASATAPAAATSAPVTAGPTATRLPIVTPAPGSGRLVASGPPGLSGDLAVAFGDGPIWFVSPPNAWYTVQLVAPQPDAVAITPAWSPDGNQLVFSLRSTRAPEGGTLPPADLYAVGVDGQSLRRFVAPLAAGEVNQDPVWLPDGSGLLFTSSAVLVDASGLITGFKLGIDRVDAQGGGRTTVIATAASPAVSPDGSHLAYLRPSADGLRQGLFVAGADGRNERLVVPDTRFLGIVSPRFTPDSTALTFVASETFWPTPAPAPGVVERLLDLFLDGVAEAHFGPFDVWRVDLDGGNLVQLLRLNYDQPAIAWAPDGGAVALVSPEGLNIAAPDGSNVTLASDTGGHGGVDWRP